MKKSLKSKIFGIKLLSFSALTLTCVNAVFDKGTC
jgi:hypothetical protein